MDKSFALLRTNVKLTSNVKLVVTASYSFYLESIDSHPELSKSRYKKQSLTTNTPLQYKLSTFFAGTSKEISFFVKDDADATDMTTDFARQHDEIYYYGGKNIANNKNYDEEFEYFAPLHVSKSNFPSHFMIFRIDGPGLVNVDRTNFRTEVLNKMKVIKSFDLTPASTIGKFLELNYTKNDFLPNSCLFVTFKEELSTITGVDLSLGGGMHSKSRNLRPYFKIENAYSDTDKYFTDIWKDENLVYPFIVNLSFLFDDKPATPNSLRKWSLNRYLGFYFDKINFYQDISPNPLPDIEDDAYIDKNNILKTTSGKQPFSDADNLTNYPYIEVEGVRYKVLECPCGDTGGGSSKCWKIISDKNLEGIPLKPPGKKPNIVEIVSENGVNTIRYTDETLFEIPTFDQYDMWLISIDNRLHRLIKDELTSEIRILTDYAFEISPGQIDYYVNDPDPAYRKTLKFNVETPTKFSIYYAMFTDIKDFDTDIVETKFARYEYERPGVITRSQESKFFFTDLNSQTLPKATHDFTLGTDVVYLPCASHYTANHELFRLSGGNPNYILNDLWKKNPKIVKWGYKNSLSTGNTQYLLNNSLSADDYNRTTNTLLYNPTRIEKNLDYFYTVNSDSNAYTFHSLHIEDQKNGVLDQNFKFELDKYLGLSYSNDYFSYFFGKRNEYQDGEIIQNDKKWSLVNGKGKFPDETCNTLFKGLKYNFYEIKSLRILTKIINLDTLSTNQFENYKFAVLLSQNDYDLEPVSSDVTKANVFPIKSSFNYEIYDTFKTDYLYGTGSVVLWNDMLFRTPTAIKTSPTQVGPKGTSFAPITERNIFWSPTYDGTNLVTKNNMRDFSNTYKPVVYNNGEYWYLGYKIIAQNGVNTNADITLKYNFWNPYKTYKNFGIQNTVNNYTSVAEQNLLKQNSNTVTNLTLQLINIDNTVIFKGKIWVSIYKNNTTIPGENDKWFEIDFERFFGKTGAAVYQWRRVRLYVANLPIGAGQYLVKNNVLYLIKNDSGNPPDPETNTTVYRRIHSFDYKSNFTYGASFSSNDLIKLHDSNKIYKILPPLQVTAEPGVRIVNKLNDGVNIYINRKWKNILVNIYSNDGTLSPFMKGRKRDDLYNDLFKKFVARNFTDYINNFEIGYSFGNLVRYIIINEDGSVKIYDFNNPESAKKLPFRIEIEEPTGFIMSSRELNKTPLPIQQNVLKPTKYLDNGKILTYDQINWYSDVPYSNLLTPPSVSSGFATWLTSVTAFYRHNGRYSPIFHDIQLFKSYGLTNSQTNYKFDTELTNFGMTGELIISKVNRTTNVLKLANSTTQRSVFPMLDETGYQVTKCFIFKSKWDFGYLKECFIPNESNTSGSSLNIVTDNPQDQV